MAKSVGLAQRATIERSEITKQKSKIGNLSKQDINVSFWHMSFQVPF